MSDLRISLHPAQMEVFNHSARFKVVAAGRRFGKSTLALTVLAVEALSSALDVSYVAPTFGQAKDIIWQPAHDLLGDLIKRSHSNDGWIELVNGRRIHVKGADRPDTMRGTARSLYVLDEFADMKPQVWEEIVRPQLADVKGRAIFIGTPKGRNHFYELAQGAELGFQGSDGVARKLDPDWAYFHYTTYDNPFIDPAEIEAAKRSLSTFAFQQEFMASFEAAASELFMPEWFVTRTSPSFGGQFYISVDLAGFSDETKISKSKLTKLDETAISVVKVADDVVGNWWVKEIQHGRWPIRETAVRILKAYRDHRPIKLGIEKGVLYNAMLPILKEEQARYGIHFEPEPLTHGNKSKIDRIVWALQGRFEKRLITLNEGRWSDTLRDQLLQFPDSKTHDDLVDSLAYIAQLTEGRARPMIETVDTFQPLDIEAGY